MSVDLTFQLGEIVGRKRRRHLAPKWQYVGLGALALVTAGTVGLAVVGPKDQQPVSAAVSQAATAGVTMAPSHPAAKSVADVAPTLKNKDQTFTLSVIGDSTGVGPNAWVRQVVEQIVAQTGRAATIHDWNLKTNAYDPPSRMGPAGKETLVVWNGSASGQSAQYASDHLKDLMPEPADLVIVNHGHNIYGPVAADSQFRQLMVNLRTSAGKDSAVAFTLQNPRTDKDKDRDDSVRPVIESYGKTLPGVTMIDAYTPFMKSGDVPALLSPDGLHPDRAGYTVWANTVLPMLGLQPTAG